MRLTDLLRGELEDNYLRRLREMCEAGQIPAGLSQSMIFHDDWCAFFAALGRATATPTLWLFPGSTPRRTEGDAVSTPRTIDPTRLAAAALVEELARLAGDAALRLRGPGELPAIAVGRLLVMTDKTLVKLRREVERLQPMDGGAR